MKDNLRSFLRNVAKNKKVYLFLLPGILFYLIFTIYPLFYSLRMSFLNWKIVGESTFAGFQNYIKALHDPVLGIAFRNTIIYGIVTVPGQMAFGLGFAVLLNRKIRSRSLFRTLYYLPVVTSWVVVSLLFEFLFNGQAGAVNYVLKDVLHVVPHYIRWLSHTWTALAVIMILGIWKGIGWSMVIFLGGLQNIPRQLYEAAAIDGANRLQQFFKITLPLLKPTIVFVLIMLVIGSFQVFISVWLITEGKPLNQTHVVLTWLYTQGFSYLHFGYGAAISWLLFVIIFLVSFFQFKYFRREGTYYY